MTPLLKIPQVASLLRISYRQVLMRIAKGELPAFRLGNSYRIAETDLKQYLEDNRYISHFPRD